MGLYKKAKAYARKAVGAAKKRYMAKPGGRKSTGGLRVAKMAKDIMYLKSVLNPEKKRTEAQQIETQPIGQVNGNTDGGHFSECTPQISQGVANYQRTGSSVKLHSSIWNFEFKQEVGVVADVKLILEIFAIDKEPYAPSLFTFRDERFKPNFFISGAEIRDYNCQMNPDNYMKGRCIARRKLTIKGDQVASQSNITHLKVPIKYGKNGRHLRWENNTNTLQSGQMYLCIRADRGNIGGVSTLAVPDVNINTGLNMRWNRMDYYYDN